MSNLETKATGQGHLFGLNWERMILVCLGILPYLMVASLGGMIVFMGVCLVQRPKAIFQRLYRSGLIWVTLLLILSTLQATYIGEASLQLLNFLPYFLLWAAIADFLTRHQKPWRLIEQWAWVLVLGSIPASLIAGLEYAFKQYSATAFPRLLQMLPPLDWLYTGLAEDPRAYGLFDSPNTLANYAVMGLGLALGLLINTLQRSQSQSSITRRYAALGLSIISLLMALYCSGSRNGYLVALILLVGCLFTLKSQPWLRWLGLGVLGAIAISTTTFGIGGRQISWQWVTQDPRVYAWRLALQLIHDSPLWGHGLGSYKFLYDGSAPGYAEIPHAHNVILSLGAEAGIPATVVLVIVIGLIIYKSMTSSRKSKDVELVYETFADYKLCLTAFLLFSLLDVTFYDARINLLLWLSLAIISIPTKSTNVILL